ncbi:MAG TPA: patatin-like phospholipase family protein [Acidobacteriota bacterium]|nr:patatin-like phospholipase family protein [Acidobacteriota bacterium]
MTAANHEYPFRNLVFEGGGVKGLAYLGALEVLQKKGILDRIVRVGGTSAGSVNALLLALGYSLEEMNGVLSSIDFRSLLDDDWGIIRDTRRLLTRFGWYKGDRFREWVAELIARKTGNAELTFRELWHRKDEGFLSLYVYGVNLSTRFGEVFSRRHTPSTQIAEAIRISMSIPLFFTAFRSSSSEYYVDGGLLENYPIKLFDRLEFIEEGREALHARPTPYYERLNRRVRVNPYVYNRETLGFRLDSGREITAFREGSKPIRHQISNFFDFTWALIETVLESQQNQHLHSDDWQRTIYIDTLGVRTTDFQISQKKRKALIQSGRSHTLKYFSWYDNSASQAINRPCL